MKKKVLRDLNEVLMYKYAFVGVKSKRKENKKEFSKYMLKLGANSRMEKGNRMNLKHPTANPGGICSYFM